MISIRHLLFTASLAIMCSSAWSAPISEGQARDIAASFMARLMPRQSLPRLAYRSPRLNSVMSSDQAAYYVFNAADGYVIVAGDDCIPPVLGYSDSGAFDAADVPPAMQEWLDGYAAQVEVCLDGVPDRTVILPTENNRRSLELYFKYGLPVGKHKITMKVLNPDRLHPIEVRSMIVYSDQPAPVTHTGK